MREIDDDEGRRLLRIIRRGTGPVVTWRRAQMVPLSAQGMPVAKIAEVSFTGDDRVRDARVEHLYAIADGEAIPEDDKPEVVFCADEFGPLNLMPHPGRQWAERGGHPPEIGAALAAGTGAPGPGMRAATSIPRPPSPPSPPPAPAARTSQ